MQLLLIDNHDSFTFNLAQLLRGCGARLRVERNDAIGVDAVLADPPDALVISPGPGGPASAGVSVAAIQACYGRVPILGVCLGHQALAAAFGGAIAHAPVPVHGKATRVHHAGGGLFEGIPSPFLVGRYHSLAAVEATLPQRFTVAARAEDGTIMGIADARARAFGVQFHPESFLTQLGERIAENFLEIACPHARRPSP